MKATTSSLSSASARKAGKKKSSVSFRQEKQIKQTSNVWENYDFDELGEMTDEQLSTFKKLPKKLREKFRSITRVHVKSRESALIVDVSKETLNQLLLAAKKEGCDWHKLASEIFEQAVANF